MYVKNTLHAKYLRTFIYTNTYIYGPTYKQICINKCNINMLTNRTRKEILQMPLTQNLIIFKFWVELLIRDKNNNKYYKFKQIWLKTFSQKNVLVLVRDPLLKIISTLIL